MVVFKKKLVKRSGVRRSLDDDGDHDPIVTNTTATATASESAFTVRPVHASEITDTSVPSVLSEAVSALVAAPVVLNLDDLDDSDGDNDHATTVVGGRGSPLGDDGIKMTPLEVANEYGNNDYDDVSENKLRRHYSDDDVGIDIDDDDDTSAAAAAAAAGADSDRYHREVDAAPHLFPRVLNISEQISSLQNMRRLAEAKKLRLQQQEAEALQRLDDIAAKKLELQRELSSW